MPDNSTSETKVLRYAYSNRSITIFPSGCNHEATYPSLAVNLPTGPGTDVDVFAETVQVHAGSHFWMPERTLTIHARRLVVLPTLPNFTGGAPSEKVIFEVSGFSGDAWTEAASSKGKGTKGWVRENYHGLWWDYNYSYAIPGQSGDHGKPGRPGHNAGRINILAEMTVCDGVTVELHANGGDGSKGQTGGNGGEGGDGATSGDMRSTDEDAGCKNIANGADGGAAGWGGVGGNAGPGGDLTWIHFGSPEPATLEMILPEGQKPSQSWGEKIAVVQDVSRNLRSWQGDPGKHGDNGTPGGGGAGGRWEHIVFINTTRGTPGNHGGGGQAAGDASMADSRNGKKASPGSIKQMESGNRVGDSYMDQYFTYNRNYDPLWLASIVKRLAFELQIIFGMTGLDFLDRATIRKRIGEIPDTIRWLSAFYQAWSKDTGRYPGGGSLWHYDEGLWHDAVQIFKDSMDELMDMKSHRVFAPTDMFGNPFNWLPAPNADMDNLDRAVKDLENVSALQVEWSDLVSKTQIKIAEVKAIVDKARIIRDAYSKKSEQDLQNVRKLVSDLESLQKEVDTSRAHVKDELSTMYDHGSPAPFGKEKALAIIEALGTVMMFTEPQVAITAKSAGSVLSMATAGITTPNMMSTPTGDYDPRFVRTEVQQIGVDMQTDLELGDAIVDAAKKGGLLQTTVTVDTKQFYSLCNKFFSSNQSVHAKQLFDVYFSAGQKFNQKVITYNQAIREHAKLSLDYLNAKKLIEKAGAESERVDTNPALMAGFFTMIQSMQQREILALFNSDVKALQALTLRPTSMVDNYIGLGSWDKLFIMDPHGKSAASTLSSNIGREIREFRSSWNDHPPASTKIKVTLTPHTHPWVFNVQKGKDGALDTQALVPFAYDLTWEQLAKHASPTFNDLYDIRLKDAWVYLVGARDCDATKKDILVSARLGGNFDIGDMNGAIHPFQAEAVNLTSQYQWSMQTIEGKSSYTTVPITQVQNSKLFQANLGKEASNESFPIQGIVRQWELSWAEKSAETSASVPAGSGSNTFVGIDVSEVTSIVIDMDVVVRGGGITPKVTPSTSATNSTVLVRSQAPKVRSQTVPDAKDTSLTILNHKSPPIDIRLMYYNPLRGIRNVFRIANDTYHNSHMVKTIVDENINQAWKWYKRNEDAKRWAKTRRQVEFARIEIAKGVRTRSDEVRSALLQLMADSRPQQGGSAVGGARFPWLRPANSGNGSGGGDDDSGSGGGDGDEHDSAFVHERVTTKHANELKEANAAFRSLVQAHAQGATIINPTHTQQLLQQPDNPARRTYVTDHIGEIFSANAQYATDKSSSLEGCMVIYGNSGCAIVDKVLTSTKGTLTVHSMLSTPIGSQVPNVFSICLDSTTPNDISLSRMGFPLGDLSQRVSQQNALLRDLSLTTTFKTLPHVLEMNTAGGTDLESILKKANPTLYDWRLRMETLDIYTASGVQLRDLIESGGVKPLKTVVHDLQAANGKTALQRFFTTSPDQLANSTPIVTDVLPGIDVLGDRAVVVAGLQPGTNSNAFHSLTLAQLRQIDVKVNSFLQHALDTTRLREIRKEVTKFLAKSLTLESSRFRTTGDLLTTVRKKTDYNTKFATLIRDLVTKHVNLGQLISELTQTSMFNNISNPDLEAVVLQHEWAAYDHQFIGERGLIDGYAVTCIESAKVETLSTGTLASSISNLNAALQTANQQQQALLSKRHAMSDDDPKVAELEAELIETDKLIERQKAEMAEAAETKKRQDDDKENHREVAREDKELKDKEDKVRRGEYVV